MSCWWEIIETIASKKLRMEHSVLVLADSCMPVRAKVFAWLIREVMVGPAISGRGCERRLEVH